jgi:hypothetical protein
LRPLEIFRIFSHSFRRAKTLFPSSTGTDFGLLLSFAAPLPT